MRAWRVKHFGVGNLQMEEMPMPEVAPGQVLIRVRAVSLNYRDLLVVRGEYNPKMLLPRVPCSDGSGEVVSVGDGVGRVKVGDRVCGVFMQRWMDGVLTAEKSKGALGGDVDGMLAEYVVLNQEGVVRFPEHLSFEEAATLPCAGVTAWNALHHAGDPKSPAKEGDVVLIQGTGGVSIFALQFAKVMGAKVIGISSSAAKMGRAYELGIDTGCNYREQPEWFRWALETTGGRGVDRVIEVGGAGTLGHSLRAVRVGGLVAQIGVLSGRTAEATAITPILHKQIRVQGIYVGSRAMFEEMNEAIAEAKLTPVVDRVFGFEEVREAIATMESGAHFGKVVIRTDDR